MLAVAQSTEGRAAKRRWDETLRSHTPNPGWTTRLGDIGRPLGITAVAAGKILGLLGYRFDKRVTDAAVAAECSVRRWTVSRCTMIGTSTGWCQPSDRQPKSPANRQSLMLSRQRSTDGRRGSGLWPASVNRTRRKLHVGKRRRPWYPGYGLSCELRATDPDMSLLTAVE